MIFEAIFDILKMSAILIADTNVKSIERLAKLIARQNQRREESVFYSSKVINSSAKLIIEHIDLHNAVLEKLIKEHHKIIREGAEFKIIIGNRELTIETKSGKSVSLDYDNSSAAKRKEAYDALTVTQMHQEQRTRKNFNASVVMAFAVAGYALVATWVGREIQLWPISIGLAYLGILYVDQALSLYRIKNGFFGNNEFEAREIIQFIVSKNDGFDGPDGRRVQIFGDAEVKSPLAENVHGGQTI